MDEVKYKQLKQYIENSDNICFFCGAGVSTASGIPDFRGSHGLFRQDFIEDPEYLLSVHCLRREPIKFFNFYRSIFDLRNAEPNPAHKFMAMMEHKNKLTGIVSQNVDMLYEKAGATKVHKVHGTIGSSHCAVCGRKYNIDTIFDNKDVLPCCTCDYPGNYLIPDIVLYGGNLPEEAVDGAYKSIANADCLIICGTSLNVYPISNFVEFVGEAYIEEDRPAPVIIVINKEPLKLKRRRVDLEICGDMTPVFERLCKDFA